MNRILIALLVASLGLNAWLAFSSIRVTPAHSPAPALDRQANPAAAKKTSASANGAEPSTPAAGTERPFVWKNPGNSPAALRELASNLRAAGVPPAIVARMVGETLRTQIFADIARLPSWQLMAPSKETRRRQSEAARELLRQQEEIVGPEGAAVKTLDPTQRRLDYGDLPDDKVTALLRIQRDYDDLRGDLFSSGGVITREESEARRTAQENLEKERLADIAAALTPEELAEYERRQSPAALRVQRSLRDLNLTEDSYLALLALEKARDPYNSNFVGSIGTVTPEKLAYMDQVRTTLGDAQANTYLKSADFYYGMVARFAEKYPTITPTQTYELYRLQSEAQAAMRPADGGGVRDIAKLQATMSDLNARLDKLVGPAVADAYRKQGSGMVFSSFRPSSPPPAAAPPKG